MNPAALVYLQNDEHAQRLAVAWPLVERGKDKRKLEISWSEVSGVNEYQVRRIGPVLRAHGICREDGTVDETAMRYVAQMALAKLPRPRATKESK